MIDRSQLTLLAPAYLSLSKDQGGISALSTGFQNLHIRDPHIKSSNFFH